MRTLCLSLNPDNLKVKCRVNMYVGVADVDVYMTRNNL